MTSPQDESFARAVIRLRLADESSVGECLKTVADGQAPSLADAMVQHGVLARDIADRVAREAAAEARPAADPAAPEEAPLIAGYELLEKLGEGGMGTVWKARQTSLNRLVAIKLLPPAFSAHKNLIERFRREALATAKLHHPNIVAAIDVGVQHRLGAPDFHYFVMEYVQGESLEDLIGRHGPVDAHRAVDIVAAVASALDHAWTEASIVHRDVKPANILITPTGAAKLTDLGLARSAWDDVSLTTAGLAIGTPHYVSPEQAQGLPGVDTRSDIYSLGATLFHMLTGQTPFKGDTAAAVMAKHVNEDPPFCSDVNGSVPVALAAVVARMMRRNPDERYQTPGELLADLGRLKRGDRPLAYTRMLDAHEGRRVASSTRLPEVFTAGPDRGGGLARRSRPLHLVHAVGAALFVAAIAFAVWYAAEHHVGPYSNDVELSFQVFNPDALVGGSGPFPAEFSARSRVQCYVKPRNAAHVWLLMVSNDGPAGVIRVRVLLPEPGEAPPLAESTLHRFPRGAAAYALPPSASTVAFVAAVSGSTADRAVLEKRLERALTRPAEAGPITLGRIPRGRTLWYSEADRTWSTGGDEPDARTAAAALQLVCERIREAFVNNPVALHAAAVSCAPG